MMELTWIEDFIALEVSGNFTEASEQRHVTQPAFSRRIKQLEEWCSVQLFNRDTRPVTLTPAGLIFKDRAERIRADILDMRRIIRVESSHLINPVRIWTTHTLAVYFFVDWARHVKLDNYSLIVSSTSGCVEALRQKRADRIIIPTFTPLQEAQILARDHLIPFVAMEQQDTIQRKNNTLHGNFMLYTPGTLFGAVIDEKLRALDWHLESKAICESASAEALWAQIVAGMGCAWVPQIMRRDEKVVVPRSLKNLIFSYDIVSLQ